MNISLLLESLPLNGTPEDLAMAARILGKKGGSVKSTRKAKASRKNGKLGGNPQWLAMRDKKKGSN